MTLTIDTKKFVELLTDALQTAVDYRTGGVHLATHRGEWGEEPGEVDLLAATSTTHWVFGHTWIPVDGQLEASVWPVESVNNVLAICKTLAGKWSKGKPHTVDVDLVVADYPEPKDEDDAKKQREHHPGWTVTLSETPALFDSDTEFQFHAHHEERFPLRNVGALLGDSLDSVRDAEYVDSPLTLWSPGVLAPLLQVAKRRKKGLQFYRSQFRRVQLVQIGDTWLGAACPQTPLREHAPDGPTVEPLLGDTALLFDLRAALADMKARGIRVEVTKPKGAAAQVIADAMAETEPDPNQTAIDDDSAPGVEE